MNSTIRAAAAAVACACALSLVACSNGGGGGGGGGGDTKVSISQQPASQTVADGVVAQFAVAAQNATGTRWQRSDDGGKTWNDIPGATLATLAIFANYATRDAQYRAVVTGQGSEATSAVVKLDVTPVAPQVQFPPQSQTIQAGYSVHFDVTCIGTQPSLQWQTSRDGASWTDVAGATAASLAVVVPDSTTTGTQYRVVATNPAGSVTSPAATLTVVPSSLTPVFLTWPTNATVPPGGTARFDARTMGESTGETIQWQVSADHGATWTDLPGPQFSQLALVGVTAADDGKQFRRLAGNAHDRVLSGVATLTVAATAARLDLLAGQLGGNGDANGTGADARFAGSAIWPSTDLHGNVYVGSYSMLRKVDPAGVVTSVVGNGGYGVGGVTEASAGRGGNVDLGSISGTATARDGTIYSADVFTNTIRKTLPDGSTSVFAGTPDQVGGSADGTGAAARFLHPRGLALDLSGNLFVADTDNHTIRKITPGGVVTTLAGKAGVAGSGGTTIDDARFNRPLGLAVDGLGSVYVTDSGNATVRVITPIGNVNTLAGSPGVQAFDDGAGAAARFALPSGIAVDSGGVVYVGDIGRVRTITNGHVQTLVGADGSATANVLGQSNGLALDPDGGVVAFDGLALWRVSAGGVVSALAGADLHAGSVDGAGGAARFNMPQGLVKDSAGNLYVGDIVKGAVRKVTPAGVVTTLATGFAYPGALALDTTGNLLVGENCAIRRVARDGSSVALVAGIPGTCGAVDGDAASTRLETVYAVAVDTSGNLLVSDSRGLHRITPAGDATLLMLYDGNSLPGPAGVGRVSNAMALAFDPAGNLLLAVPDAVYKLAPDGSVSAVAGGHGPLGNIDGPGDAAAFAFPNAIAPDAAGNVYVANRTTVRRIAPDRTVTTVLGTSNASGVVLGTSPLVNQISGLAVLDAQHLAVLSENAVLVYTLP